MTDCTATPDLFGHTTPPEPRYPDIPGSRYLETSRKAAEGIAPKAPTLRAKCFALLRSEGPATADEVAAKMQSSILSIRPRIAELNGMGLIVDTGTRRANASGNTAVVWRAVMGGVST